MSRVWKFLFSFMIFVTVCYGGLVWFVNHEVKKGIDQAVTDTAGMTMSYNDLSVSLTDHCVELTDVTATLPDGQQFFADTIRILRFDQLNPVPHYVEAEASGMVMTTTYNNFGAWAGPLKDMGLDVVTGTAAIDYQYNPETKALTLNTLEFKTNELGETSFTGMIDRIDLTELGMEKLIGLRITTADISFTDRSLIDIVVRSSAKDLGVTEEEARARMCNELTAMADYAGKDDNNVAENALRGFKRFIDNPGSIIISARPSEPVPVLYFFMGRDFYDNIRLLNLSVETDSGDDI